MLNLRQAADYLVVSKVLNHANGTSGMGAVSGAHDCNAYMREKRAALDAWAALLVEIVDRKERADNVVSFARAGTD